MIVGEPKVGLGAELGSESDVFKMLLDGRRQKSTFTRRQLTFADDEP